MATGRTILIGDIHGCAREFGNLLERARYAQGVDRLVLVGDLVARGPDSAGVVALARSVGARAVRGNHDEKLLSWWRVAREKGGASAARKVKLSDKHREAAATLGLEHWSWLAALPLLLALPEHGVLVVHAGLHPMERIDDQHPHVVMNLRSLDEEGRPTRKLGGTPWARVWRGPAHVVFGHDARRNLQLERYATGLDTGCCYGRELSALVLEAGEPVPADPEVRRGRLVQVSAARAYCPCGRWQRSRVNVRDLC